MGGRQARKRRNKRAGHLDSLGAHRQPQLSPPSGGTRRPEARTPRSRRGGRGGPDPADPLRRTPARSPGVDTPRRASRPTQSRRLRLDSLPLCGSIGTGVWGRFWPIRRRQQLPSESKPGTCRTRRSRLRRDSGRSPVVHPRRPRGQVRRPCGCCRRMPPPGRP